MLLSRVAKPPVIIFGLLTCMSVAMSFYLPKVLKCFCFIIPQNQTNGFIQSLRTLSVLFYVFQFTLVISNPNN